MKILLTILITSALTGCYQNTDQLDLRRASAFCGSYDNVLEISVLAIGMETVTCLDGRAAVAAKVKLTEETK